MVLSSSLFRIVSRIALMSSMDFFLAMSSAWGILIYLSLRLSPIDDVTIARILAIHNSLANRKLVGMHTN